MCEWMVRLGFTWRKGHKLLSFNVLISAEQKRAMKHSCKTMFRLCWAAERTDGAWWLLTDKKTGEKRREALGFTPEDDGAGGNVHCQSLTAWSLEPMHIITIIIIIFFVSSLQPPSFTACLRAVPSSLFAINNYKMVLYIIVRWPNWRIFYVLVFSVSLVH